MPTEITFFDIPTRLPVPTSPNTWKVRLVLNFKGLEYKTHWVPTICIQEVCKSHHIPPTSTYPSGQPHYTLPALIDYTSSASHPVILSDSTPIIEYLERQYPSPGYVLFPRGTRSLHAVFEHFITTNILSYGRSLWLMGFYRNKFPDDQVHFRERMEEMYGKSLEKIELQGVEREKAWVEVERTFTTLAEFMEKNKGEEGGEYVMGRDVSFSDFALWSCLITVKNVSPDEGWPKIVTWEGGRWEKYFRACERWMEVGGATGAAPSC